MSYYLVKCKCGHVSRKFYMPIIFAIEAVDGKEAAEKARHYPRVKHDHKDAILECIETNYETYLEQLEDNHNDLYLKCKSKKDQNIIYASIEDRLVLDPHWKSLDTPSPKNRKPNLLMQKKKYVAKQEDFLD